MKLHEIARNLARLREQLEEVGVDYPQLQRRIEALTHSLEHLQQDLAEMRHEREADRGPHE